MVKNKRFVKRLAFSILVAILIPFPIQGSGQSLRSRIDELDKLPCCDFTEVPGVVWVGNDPVLTFQELAAYCAPILWFSPDEPLLDDASGVDIRIPEPLPFEDQAGAPVVYYRVRSIMTVADDEAYTPDTQGDVNQGLINLENVIGFDLDYFFYYHREEGTGAHKHDTEAAFFKITVWKRDECPECRFALIMTQALGKAHLMKWYDNTLDIDGQTVLPITLLVEEGKHATCTDKNGDGYYTPGYDVSRRVNDAWGVRDVIRTGLSFSGGFESWMAKVRQDRHRVFPPLPEDSPIREPLMVDGIYAPNYAKYSLRPIPIETFDHPEMKHLIADKGKIDWPVVEVFDEFKQFGRWLEAENWMKSLAIAYRYDGDSGFSFAFPLFVVKNFEDPLAGGYLVHRMYLKDKKLRDFGWMLNYSLSASRWLDGYIAGGVEWDVMDLPEGGEKLTGTETNFVFETGIKFRVNLSLTPMKFLTKLTDFWGVRFGIKSVGAFDIKRLMFVVEIGAGTW